MPNWVYNTVAISGDRPTLDALKAQLNQPVTKYYPEHKFDNDTKEHTLVPSVQHYSNPVFSFWNVIAPTDLDTYFGQHTFEPVPEGTDILAKIRNDFATKSDWYNWNVRNWGTKWDIAVEDNEKFAETELEDNGDSLLYRFSTAWSPVFEVFDVLSSQYPTLDFDYEYEEEQGWGGNAVYHNGEMITHSQYDIPSSHADYVERNRECSCEVEGDYPQFWYEDCPVDETKYEFIDGEWSEKTLDTDSTDVLESH